MRIERERRLPKQGTQRRETAYGLTSLDAARAGPEEIAALVRRHWEIENRLHSVRDFTYDEDRGRAHVGNLPRHLACPTNAAISIVRREGRFRHLPPANRHYAVRPQEALDAVLKPPASDKGAASRPKPAPARRRSKRRASQPSATPRIRTPQAKSPPMRAKRRLANQPKPADASAASPHCRKATDF